MLRVLYAAWQHDDSRIWGGLRRGAQTERYLATALPSPRLGQILRALQRKRLVKRPSQPWRLPKGWWQITPAGRRAMERANG